MSRTTKQIGSATGYAKTDPGNFDNPGQQTRLDAGKTSGKSRVSHINRQHRDSTTSPNINVMDRGASDPPRRSHADPQAKMPSNHPSHAVRRKPAGYAENVGK